MPVPRRIVMHLLDAGYRIVATKMGEKRPMSPVAYHLEPSGEEVSYRTFQSIRPALEPVDPGLFDDDPQTFRLAK